MQTVYFFRFKSPLLPRIPSIITELKKIQIVIGVWWKIKYKYLS